MENTNVNTTVENEEGPRGKIIFNYGIAKALVRKGFEVIDIKQNRENGNTLLVFRDCLKLRDSMQEIVKERRKARADRAKAEEEIQEPTIEQED